MLVALEPTAKGVSIIAEAADRHRHNNESSELALGMLTVQEVARLLHVHANTVRKWSDRGLLKAYRIGHRGDRRFAPQDVFDFLIANGERPKPRVRSSILR